MGIVQLYEKELQQALLCLDPIDVCHLLYSKRCISSDVLDEIETLETTVEHRRTELEKIILPQANSMDQAAKYKSLVTVLAKFEETKHLALKILSKCSNKYE